MKRIIRQTKLMPEEAAKYQAIRQQVDVELPDLIARQQAREVAEALGKRLVVSLEDVNP